MSTAAVLPPPAAAAVDPTPLDACIERVCARIAPTWPLDRFIAVNPFWELVQQPLPEVAGRLAALSGAQLLMPRAWYRQALREGRLQERHLAAALRANGSPLPLSRLLQLLATDEPTPAPRALVVDLVDAGRDLTHEPSWRAFVMHNVSQFCAAFFDDGQATFGPDREGGLYASWRRQAQRDRSPALLLRARDYRLLAAELPACPRETIAQGLAALEVPADEQEAYLWSLLLAHNGWASWCAYRRWTARLAGGEDDTMVGLLAIRLAWEWLLLRLSGPPFARRWAAAKADWPQREAEAAAARADDWLLQEAMEIAWREPVLQALPTGLRAPRPQNAAVQAVFCIDVRSEVFRRALESVAPAVQTLGFAGFFGLPLEYQPLAAPGARPKLPGLLAPRLRATDLGLEPEVGEARARAFDLAASWRAFQTDPSSTFTFVESLGLTYASSLVRDGFALSGPSAPERHGLSAGAEARRRPRLTHSTNGQPLDLTQRADLAHGMLRGMSLTRDFARLVLLVGHGSQTRNNPHAAGLDCGACCGQTGEVNARVAAALLNDPAVRAELRGRGVEVPETTRFLAALHQTTDDEVELFELDELPATHRAEVDALRLWLAAAGERTRLERAEALGLKPAEAPELARAIRTRTRDWAQVRAEWGLANNAAFIVAPREHCRHLQLGGRSFLHEYRHAEDPDHSILELIMTAPMVVTHWINFQYYASTVDNLRYGSGNKVLHNVVGGHLGVFEGNGGDLRIGLPLQSLHDGTRWVHEPLRLSVFLEAPRSAIDGVLARHPTVRALVEHGWIALFQLDEQEGAIYARRRAGWVRQPEASSEIAQPVEAR
ncbi:MAG: DUF2309 domain-containing protein [Verrucomicrobia bacterium]|nr:DUF2309 domain-containing protein [Verrucomicrobiota bacterium]